MKLKKSLVGIGIIVASLFVTTTAEAYRTLSNGQLFFNGYQTNSHVVSEIGDTNYRDRNWFSVEAIVYVGNKRFGSDWRYNYAKVSANRVWYANETSRYNFVRR